MGDLSRYFSRREFACKCGCGVVAVSEDLLERLDEMRAWSERPVPVRSGCRCPAWNAREGGKPESAHVAAPDQGEICEAADLAAPSSGDRFTLLNAAFVCGIKRIGIGKGFVHVDVDGTKDQEVAWLY